MTRKTLLRFLLLTGFTFLLGFSYNYHLPKIESFLLVEIERLSASQTPLRIWAQKLEFHLFPLGVVLDDVKVLAQPPLDKYLAPATLRQVGARLALWPLLRGEIRLSSVYIRDSELNVFLKNDLFAGKRKAGAGLKFDFDRLYRLPIDEIQLEGVQLQGRLDPQNVVFRVSDLNLLIENRYQSIFVEMNAPRVLVKPSGPVAPLNVQLELRTLVEAQELQVSAFKLKANDSFVVASGRFNGDFTTGRIDNGAMDARTKLQLSDLNVWESVFLVNPKIPRLVGRAELDLGLELRKDQGYRLEADLNTHDVEVDKFKVGQVQGRLHSDLKTVTSELIHAENNAGKADVSKFNLVLEPNPAVSFDLKIPALEVHELLENLSVHHVPIEIQGKGEASCQGVWTPSPELDCTAKLNVPHFKVHTEPPNAKTIVEAGDARATGSIKVTLKQVEYKAEAQAGKSSVGRSDGVISYEDGFKINYQSDHVDFADVKNLVDLKLEGGLKVSGNTVGTSKWGTVDMNLDGKDLWLEDYPIGQAVTRVNYKSGMLGFGGVTGQFGVSRYTGAVALDLRKKRIKINGQIPFMDLKDLQSLFARKVRFPVTASGTGTGRVDAEGPLRFQDMSYDFNTSFFRGLIANESFDELTFHVKSKDGLVKSEKILLTKSSGSVEVKGQITPTGQIDTVAVARALRLEQSENVLALGFDLQGLADFTVLARGQLPKPRIELNGKLSKVVLGDQAAEDSVFRLNFLSDRMEGSGQFLGTTLVSDFTFPYDNEAPFQFKLKTRKWDFTTLFSLVSKSAKQIDFNTAASMDIALQAAHGGFWASTGEVKVNEFSIRKGGKSMAAEKPMILNFKQGTINSENFAITSGDSYLKLDVAAMTRANLNASLNGKLDMSLLGLFTPFISDLRGNMALTMDLRGSYAKPQLSGSAYVDRGYVKLADFYHPFSNIRADLLFNDNQILVNALRSDFASGKISGEGKITFAGQGKRPIDLKGTFNEVKLNIPEGYHSQGSGTVAVHGDKFPYDMNINYDVTGGELTAEFQAASGGNATVKASAFLPRFLEQPTFQPFNFGVDINLKGPVSVNNSLVQTGIEGHLRVNGNPDHLALNGTITPQPGGKVFFRDQPFEIQAAYIEYTGQGPTEPKIYATANTRVIENVTDDQYRTTQNQYDVSMLVQGRGPSPQISLNSSPPLGQREIVSLLALGTTGTALAADERKTGVTEAANTSAAIGSVFLDKAGAKRVKEALGVDVKVSTAPPTYDTASAPKVTLNKQFTPKLGASASSTVEATPNNSVKLEYKMNQNISVIGSYDGRENLRDSVKDTKHDVLGLDLQYKMQFK